MKPARWMQSFYLMCLWCLHAEAQGVAPAAAWEKPAVAGNLAYQLGDYRESERLFRAALLVVPNLASSDEARALILSDLSAALMIQGKIGEAEVSAQQGLALSVKQFGEKHPKNARSLAAMAEVCRSLGKYELTTAYYERALDTLKDQEDKQLNLLIMTLSSVGDFHREHGRVQDAQTYLARALEIAERKLGKQSRLYGLLLTDLGELYHLQGRHKQAEETLTRAYTTFETLYGPDSPNLALIAGRLGALHADRGNLARAEPLLKRSIALAEKANPPLMAVSLTGLAEVYLREQKPTLARPLLEKSLAIQHKTAGVDHPQTTANLTYLAEAAMQEDKLALADELFVRVLAIQQKHLGTGHASIAMTYMGRANLSKRLGQYTEAAAYYQNAIVSFRDQLGPDHPYVGTAMAELAALVRDKNWKLEAKRLETRAKEIEIKNSFR